MKYLKYFTILTSIIFFIFINKYIRIGQVVSNSMFPTLKTGDRFIYLKKGFFKIKKNDIVLFKTQNESIYIKRCKALPEDTIFYFHGKYYHLLANKFKNEAESFIIPYKGFTVHGKNYFKYTRLMKIDIIDTIQHYTFKENYYYLRGDNILSSIDSRHIGLVRESQIIGKFIMKY